MQSAREAPAVCSPDAVIRVYDDAGNVIETPSTSCYVACGSFA